MNYDSVVNFLLAKINELICEVIMVLFNRFDCKSKGLFKYFDMDHELLNPTERARIASNPPCEFNEVFTDVQILINDDDLLKEIVTPTFAQYDKEQFLQAKFPDKNYRVLITKRDDIGNDRFYDPRSQLTFHPFPLHFPWPLGAHARRP